MKIDDAGLYKSLGHFFGGQPGRIEGRKVGVDQYERRVLCSNCGDLSVIAAAQLGSQQIPARISDDVIFLTVGRTKVEQRLPMLLT